MRLLPTITHSSAIALALLVGGCASAGGDGGNIDPAKPDAGLFVPPDANDNKPVDASLSGTPDSSVPVDAAISEPDADPTGGIFCNSHDECSAQNCCLLNLCIPGDVILDICFPS